MSTKIQELKWKLYLYKQKELMLWGMRHGYSGLYNDELIIKLRTIYTGGMPASVLLLSHGMCNGHCYDRALLMARAFLDTEDDVNLICADVDFLRLNPLYAEDEDPNFADHCIVERITKDGKHIIYDTTQGIVCDKRLYWLMEHPKVRLIKNKQSIINQVREEEIYEPEDLERDKYSSIVILPMLELSYDFASEIYAIKDGGLLKREIEHYKKVIGYNEIRKEVEEEIEKGTPPKLFKFKL